MHTITLLGNQLHLLAEKAIYLPHSRSLLVSDVHLGKSETFQAAGMPIPNAINQATLTRLQHLCDRHQPAQLLILGDLFHSRLALVNEVMQAWQQFLAHIQIPVSLLVGNHDRALGPQLEQCGIHCIPEALQLPNLVLSHHPHPSPQQLNICGHIHPCVRLKTRLDNLRLPCFYLQQNTLILPSFGDFTGGYEMPLAANTTAFVVVENTVLPIAGRERP